MIQQPLIEVYNDVDEISRAAADVIVQQIQKTLSQKDKFTIALSGGSTPKKLHLLLAASPYKEQIDWTKIHVFWGDERFVPLEDERSNAKMAYDTLLNHVPIPAANIHIMPTNVEPEQAAVAYEKILHQYFDNSNTSFDLVLLGMGDDGHTLSLFPGLTNVIHEQEKWCTSLWLQAQDMYRITLTAPIVNKAANILFLVAGANKAHVLKEVLYGPFQPDLYPSQVIHPDNGLLHWMVDQAAAANL